MLDELPAYEEHLEHAGAPLMESDALMNDGLPLHRLDEDDEAISMGESNYSHCDFSDIL